MTLTALRNGKSTQARCEITCSLTRWKGHDRVAAQAFLPIVRRLCGAGRRPVHAADRDWTSADGETVARSADRRHRKADQRAATKTGGAETRWAGADRPGRRAEPGMGKDVSLALDWTSGNGRPDHGPFYFRSQIGRASCRERVYIAVGLES